MEITEIELNPLGDDGGNEWVELYSADEVNLSEYYLANSDSQIYNLTGTFTGYTIVTFPKQWLDNKDEILVLLKGAEVLTVTDNLSDSKNDEFTWNYCDKWTFLSNSKGLENNCPSDEINEDQNESEEENNENIEDQTDEDETNETLPIYIEDPIVPEMDKKLEISTKREKIVLGASGEEYETNDGILRGSMIYVFSGLCLLLLALLAMNKLK